MNKKIITFIFLIFITFYVFSDATDDKKEISLADKYKEILNYGIEEEVVEILNNLGDSPGKDFYSLLENRYKEASLPKTKIALIHFFSNCTNLPDNIIATLYEDAKKEPENFKVHTSILKFLGKKGNKEHGLFLIKSLDNYEELVKIASAEALSEMNIQEIGIPILNRLKESETNDEKYLSDDNKGKLILALGKLKTKEAVEYLNNIINDTGNYKYLIMYSMVALAEIQDLNSIKTIQNNLNNEDIRIQEYAGYALSKFKTDSVIPILQKMLKHNNEKIRVFACQGIVLNNNSKSVNILLYKFNKDPAANVRYEALKSLIYLGASGISTIKNYIKSNTLNAVDFFIISKAVTEKPDSTNVEFLLSIYDSAEKINKDTIAKNVVTGTSNKLDPIIKILLKSKDQYIRVNAIKAVYNIKDSSLWGIVKDLSQNDPSALVIKMAKYYLELRKI